VVIYPRDITDKAQYAIDQFVLRGGKLVAFLDPLCYFDSRNNSQMNPMMAQMGGGRQEPWVVLSELKKDYTVKQVEMTAGKIDDDIKLLVG